ncbi:hypothetical protein [Flaviaesturariibacter aridisoli]|uniref:Uncharacterized protein n=1 Tax=Flaviaesturariibacter aridisoli TaxID=2545761 RepID=A0A4R4DV95_9BACT|nr:hypothetical protein [Flaviaesturariibacter aridisoli]TCZ63863.1 hypothetical protein E0486_18385 [Flaviaesturariibacter aridisoli]TCZ65779.1 hypothetical protein E0486_17145 [Flaviaesturariibacter aridisoli]TCZ67065.1 hypothetical protein E0486_16125 [Flaviaesturariibacter aridisoli]
MTKVQNRYIAMYGAILLFCKENQALVALSPAFQKAVLWLNGQVNRIDAAVLRQQKNQQGGGAKKTTREIICATGAVLSSLAAGWANEEGLADMEARNTWTEPKLDKLSDARLHAVCTLIAEDAHTALAGGAENGITDESITGFTAALGLFKEEKDAPRKTTTARSTQTNELKKLIAQTNDGLKKRMDRNAAFYKSKHPEFYFEYKEARKLIDPASRPKKEAVNEA